VRIATPVSRVVFDNLVSGYKTVAAKSSATWLCQRLEVRRHSGYVEPG
jgi:hypothetical protein